MLTTYIWLVDALQMRYKCANFPRYWCFTHALLLYFTTDFTTAEARMYWKKNHETTRYGAKAGEAQGVQVENE